MANTYGIIEIAQPQNLTATLQAGGNLEPNTTYYYQIRAVNLCGRYVFSPRSATVSATTDDTNRSIKLDWTDLGLSWNGSYSGYHILRSTTNDFSDTAACQLSSNYAPVWTTASTFTDDGTYTQLMRTINYKTGLPTIYAYGDTTFRMADLYDYDQSQGWGRIKPCVDMDFMEFDTSFNDDGVGYYVNANLVIGWDPTLGTQPASFYHVAAPLITYGAFYSTNSSDVTIQFGSEIVNDKAAYTNNRVQLVVHGPHYNYSALGGVLYLYGLTIMVGGLHWGSYAYSGWNNPYQGPAIYAQSGSEIIDCDFYQMGNGYNITGYPSIVRGCRFAGVRANYPVTLEDVRVSYFEGIGCRHYYHTVFIRPESVFTSYDVIWRTKYYPFLLDPTFDSHGQKDTNNDPWLYLAYGNTGAGAFTFGTSLKIHVQDTSGNALTGVTVQVTDANGYSALFTEAATQISNITNTDTTLEVSDGTQFSIGDYIRGQYGQEIMKVTGIDGNVLTIERAQCGTKAQYLYRAGARDKILKRVDSLTTDANGDVDCGTMIRYVLLPAADIPSAVSAASLDTHIANGYLTKQLHTPHTITLSKTGYSTRTIIYDMTKGRDEVEVLEEYAPASAQLAASIASSGTLDIAVTTTGEISVEVA